MPTPSPSPQSSPVKGNEAPKSPRLRHYHDNSRATPQLVTPVQADLCIAVIPAKTDPCTTVITMKIAANAPTRRSREGGNPGRRGAGWVPVVTGTTGRRFTLTPTLDRQGTGCYAKVSDGGNPGQGVGMGSRLHGNDGRRRRTYTITSARGVTQRSLERETGIEPATLCLGSRCSTTELLPLTPRLVPHPITSSARRCPDSQPSWRHRLTAQRRRVTNPPLRVTPDRRGVH